MLIALAAEGDEMAVGGRKFAIRSGGDIDIDKR
jgi:hypothetical protein